MTALHAGDRALVCAEQLFPTGSSGDDRNSRTVLACRRSLVRHEIMETLSHRYLERGSLERCRVRDKQINSLRRQKWQFQSPRKRLRLALILSRPDLAAQMPETPFSMSEIWRISI